MLSGKELKKFYFFRILGADPCAFGSMWTGVVVIFSHEYLWHKLTRILFGHEKTGREIRRGLTQICFTAENAEGVEIEWKNTDVKSQKYYRKMRIKLLNFGRVRGKILMYAKGRLAALG